MACRSLFRLCALCFSLLALSGCAALTAATGSLLGRGVNANVQAGAENRQSAVSVEGMDLSPSLSFGIGSRVNGVTQTTEQNATRADTIHTYNAGIPWYWWALLGLALWVDSPKRWPGQIWAALRRK
jgi:hypothetical protein